jgi:hypothetical protein
MDAFEFACTQSEVTVFATRTRTKRTLSMPLSGALSIPGGHSSSWDRGEHHLAVLPGHQCTPRCCCCWQVPMRTFPCRLATSRAVSLVHCQSFLPDPP